MRMLNIGCGSVFHSAWHNIDMVSSHPGVRACDITKGLPYPDGSFDVCYSSHVLEHLDRGQAKRFVDECRRVLKPGGVVRIVVPDLEGIAKNYLSALDKADAGDKAASENYDWMVLELYDQAVRSRSGGEMASFLRNPDIQNKSFVLSRIGLEAESFWKATEHNAKSGFIGRVMAKNFFWVLGKFRFLITRILVRTIAGRKGDRAFSEGWFRNSGEIHRWMYDRFSLRRLLHDGGFVNITVCRAEQSRIPDFNRYELDILKGTVRKPDSIFVEALTPTK